MSKLSEWKAAKQAYERITGRHKPGKKFMGVWKATGIESAMKACDAAQFWDVPVAKEKAALQKLKTVVSAYLTQLDHALDGEASLPPPARTNLENGLDMLRTQLESYVTHYEAHANVPVSRSARGRFGPLQSRPRSAYYHSRFGRWEAGAKPARPGWSVCNAASGA